MEFAALIVAAGRGVRAGGERPKQFQMLGERSVLARTLAAFLDHPHCSAVLCVIGEADAQDYAHGVPTDPKLLPPVIGGDTRQASVRAGLEALAERSPRAVLIHDAARPFVTPAVIDRVLAAIGPSEAAFPALPLVDALWHAEDGQVAGARDRAGLWRAQTPQGFLFEDILGLHRAAETGAPDDVTLAHAAGHKVSVVMGDGNNFKITLPGDFDRARALEADLDVRTGTGYDVHAFGPGKAVILCGVEVPHDRALRGHSDADVAMHAITDALFGALAEGDIGRWFPPSEPEWKGAASEIFLRKAVERVAERGYRIANIDCTVICEEPKIGPHADAMRAEIARITGLGIDRISIKATTTERLGFTGRAEGIAADAAATLVSP